MRFLLLTIFALTVLLNTACVTTKEYDSMQSQLKQQLSAAETKLADTEQSFNAFRNTSRKENTELESKWQLALQEGMLKDQQLRSLRDQVEDLKQQRDRQQAQVGDLTVLSKSANENIQRTLTQLEAKDKYIKLLQAAKTRVDSANLSLAIDLQAALQKEIRDQTVDVKVEKTRVLIYCSNQLLFQNTTAALTSKASEVLGKIAQLLQNQLPSELLIEHYLDAITSINAEETDGWKLSADRATAVAQTLQTTYGLSADRLIAAGRGTGSMPAGMQSADPQKAFTTRIVVLPKWNQFYDLLSPSAVPK